MCSRQARRDTTQSNSSYNFSTQNQSRFTQTRITNFFSAPNQIDQTPPLTNDNTSHPTDDSSRNNLSSLPVYYNNVRSIMNKRNIAMKMELSLFKVLCFTETFLGDNNASSVYFPNNFNVYRCDRLDTIRPAGGVAILVHRSLKSRSIPTDADIDTDPDSEFIAVEVTVQPNPLIFYVCYMSEFNHRIFNHEALSSH